jgi:hypothetical protein
MAPRTHYKKLSLGDLSMVSDGNSADSKEVATQDFCGSGENALALVPITTPSHTATRTWKSQAIKDQEEYERIRQRVRHFVPGHFTKANARRSPGQTYIFPQNVKDWLIHKKEMVAMAEEQQTKNCDTLKARIEAYQKIPKGQSKIKSVFGEGGKVFHDGLTPVLALPSIWATGPLTQTAAWPSKEELQMSADVSRAYGRCLPPPRIVVEPTAPWHEQPLAPLLLLDELCPNYTYGPDPQEMHLCNQNMDSDPGFEDLGALYLGNDLMEQLGEWQPPAVARAYPQQQIQQRAAFRPGVSIIYEEPEPFGTPGSRVAPSYAQAGPLAAWNGTPYWG